MQARQKVRELRGSPVVSLEDAAGDVSQVLHKKPARTPKKGRGKGGEEGQHDA